MKGINQIVVEIGENYYRTISFTFDNVEDTNEIVEKALEEGYTVQIRLPKVEVEAESGC